MNNLNYIVTYQDIYKYNDYKILFSILFVILLIIYFTIFLN